MSNVRIELNRSGVLELLKSAGIEAAVQEQAAVVAGRLGAEWTTDTKQMPTRVIASAYTTDAKAAHIAMEDNSGLKALYGGGGT